MERKGGMDEILASTPLGRKYTVKAKLWQSTAVAAVIAFGTVLPHLWQVARLWPSLFAGTGNEYFRLAGCSEVYNFIGFAALLADLPFCCLPVHEPNYSMVGTEIGKSAACIVYQRCFVLSACVA